MLYASMQSKHKDSRNMAVERHENPLSPFSTVSTERNWWTLYMHCQQEQQDAARAATRSQQTGAPAG